MGRKDKTVEVVAEGSVRINDRALRCRACGGVNGWYVRRQNHQTVTVHSCGAVQ